MIDLINHPQYDPLTYKIVGCAMQVHRALGCGFQEKIYQRCLALEMQRQGLIFLDEYEMKIYYNNVEVGTRRLDFLVENAVVVELKAIAQLEDVHFVQTINYLKVCQVPLGLLINFGARSLQHKKIYLNSPN